MQPIPRTLFLLAKLKLYTHWVTTPHSPSPSAPNNHHSTFCIYEFDYSRYPYKWKHTVFVFLWRAYFTSYNVPKFIHIVACVKTAFLFKAEQHVYTMYFLIHSSTDGLLGGFPLLSLWIMLPEHRVQMPCTLGSLILRRKPAGSWRYHPNWISENSNSHPRNSVLSKLMTHTLERL